MFLKQLSIKAIAAVTVVSFSTSMVPFAPASAALIHNDQVVQTQTVEGDRTFVKEFMSRDDVRTQFEALGVDPAEANLRVAALSDAEVSKLAGQIKTSPAGQGAIGAVIGAALLIFVVLLITDLLGFTSVFGFTNKGSANPT